MLVDSLPTVIMFALFLFAQVPTPPLPHIAASDAASEVIACDFSRSAFPGPTLASVRSPQHVTEDLALIEAPPSPSQPCVVQPEPGAMSQALVPPDNWPPHTSPQLAQVPPTSPDNPDPNLSEDPAFPLGNLDPDTTEETPLPSADQEPPQTSPIAPSPDLLQQAGIAELTADYQEYDRQRQWVTAQGNAFARFQGGHLQADRLDINLDTQVLRATGQVSFTRGRQTLEGSSLLYNLVLQTGQIDNAQGDLDSSRSGTDLNFDQVAEPLPAPNPEERQVVPVGGIQITSGFGTSFGQDPNANPDRLQAPIQLSSFRQQGTVSHWRFQADQVNFYPGGWQADRADLTNDPLDPPQFQMRTRRLTYREISPLVSELRANNPRLRFDRLPIPTVRNRVLLDRRPRDAGLFTLGFDDRDRGGLYIERAFEPFSSDRFRWTVTPQLLVQEAFSQEGGNLLSPNAFGVSSLVEAYPSANTTMGASFVLPQIGSTDWVDQLRANTRISQKIPQDHRLSFEYSYRDRLFNGSLGFQTVQQSIGLVLQSPSFPLGNSGIRGDYQLSGQWIKADTDRPDLLAPIRDNNRVNLGRYQVTGSLSRGFSLWQGQPLDTADPSLALRYSPSPVVPQVSMGASLRGIYSLYSNGDRQEAVLASLGVNASLGHFARPWLDYTALNLGYSQALKGHVSPFTFDRLADTQVVNFGITQQLYGPLRLGFDTAFNVDTEERISSTYRLDYSRRAFRFDLSYNPVLGVGSLGLRINDLDWR